MFFPEKDSEQSWNILTVDLDQKMSIYRILRKHAISDGNRVMDTNYLNLVTAKRIMWIFSSQKNNKPYIINLVAMFIKLRVQNNSDLIKHQNFARHIWNLAKAVKTINTEYTVKRIWHVATELYLSIFG